MIYFLKEGYQGAPKKPEGPAKPHRPKSRGNGIKILVFILILSVIVGAVLFSTQSGSKNVTPSVKGIVEVQGIDCYLVKLPSGAKVDDYFLLSGRNRGNIYAVKTDANSYYQNMGLASYDTTVSGHWVCCYDGIVMYIPSAAITEDTAKSAFTSHLTINNGNYMSFETAKQYIPALNK